MFLLVVNLCLGADKLVIFPARDTLHLHLDDHMASVTMRSPRQVLVPRALLGRVTASWRLAVQAATLLGGVLAGAIAGLAGSGTRPVFAAAGSLTLITVAGAWCAGLRYEDASGTAVSLSRE